MDSVEKDSFCPVCGFDFMNAFGFKPWTGDNPSDEICPSCWIQFGYEDMVRDKKKRTDIYNKWREKWIQSGMKWSSVREYKKPENWDPIKQLQNIGIIMGLDK